MTIDRIDWHIEDNIPADVKMENSAIHIGFYMNWLIETELLDEDFISENKSEIEDLIKHKKTGLDFLIDQCDGKLISSILNHQGASFTSYYYDSYLDDFVDVVGDATDFFYEVEDCIENYQLIKAIVDKRFIEWKTVS